MFSWSWSVVPYLGGVELDMLETPSMMLENWPWEDSVVARLSKHYETGAYVGDKAERRVKVVPLFSWIGVVLGD